MIADNHIFLSKNLCSFLQLCIFSKTILKWQVKDI